MNLIWNLIDRILSKILTIYRKRVFLSKVVNNSKDVNILGKVYVNATNIKIGKNVNIYLNVYFWGVEKLLLAKSFLRKD